MTRIGLLALALLLFALVGFAIGSKAAVVVLNPSWPSSPAERADAPGTEATTLLRLALVIVLFVILGLAVAHWAGML